MQNLLVEEELLCSWREQRLTYPRENSTEGYRQALKATHDQLIYEHGSKAVDADALSNAYEAWEAMLQEETQQILRLADPDAPPFEPCAACHLETRRLIFDGTFKCCHLASCSAGHEHYDSEQRGLFVAYPSVAPYAEKRADGEGKHDCSSQYKVDNDSAKVKKSCDYQGQGVLLCAHYHVVGVSLAAHVCSPCVRV